jgi:uncharacterized protein (TIGR02246 family)
MRRITARRSSLVARRSSPGARVAPLDGFRALRYALRITDTNSPTEGTMNRILMVVAMSCLAGSVAAQSGTPTPKPGAGGPRTDLANDEAIRALYGQFVAAWNAHDAKKLASFYAIDGDTMEPDGMVAKGRDEVQKHFAEEHAMAFKDTELKLTVDSVWFLAADVALVDGTYVVMGAVDPNGRPLPPRKGLLHSVLIQEGGTWYVAASRSMIPIPLPWRPK